MIKANELRVGNWVFNEGGEPDKVCSIDFGGVSVFSINDEGHTLFEPIPLTPEIITACGFESYQNYTGRDRYFDNNWLYGEIERDGEGWNIADYESGSICKRPFHYVHQLQNLYFALTGEELEINL